MLAVQCTWSFFMCKKSAAECKQEHTDCLNGDVCKYCQQPDMQEVFDAVVVFS